MNQTLPLILIADDNTDLLRSLSLRLRNVFEVHTTTSVPQAKALTAQHEYDAAVIDLCFEGQEADGVHLIDHLSKRAPGTFLIVLSGDSTVKRVVAAMNRRLLEFVLKDGDFFDALLSALNRASLLKKAHTDQTNHRFLTRSPAVLEVLRVADRIVKSGTDAAILIQGETGSGKEVLARHIAHGAKKKLIAANMASISQETAESTLFGHMRGAFTGAQTNHIGLIESAQDGIFFLDEIGECSPAVQAKLLRALQEREVLPLGATTPRKVRVQFMAATHQDLDVMVKAGRFREDLLQRLNAFVLHLPPLRERPDDVLLYAELFLEQAFTAGAQRLTLSPKAKQALLEHSWPGNVRALKNVIDRLIAFSTKTTLDEQDVRSAIHMGKTPEKDFESKSLIQIVEGNVRRGEVLNALEKNRGSKRQTARALGVSEATLYRWIKDFGVTTMADQFKESPVAAEEEHP